MLLTLVAGCTPNRHGIDPPFPYQGNHYDEAQIADIAARRCGITAPAAAVQLNPFTTDGCSMYPDGGWRECCVAHDMDYWCANPQTTRREADRAFMTCVTSHSNAFNGRLTYLGVRVLGHGALPFPWRWGYGYPWLETP